MVKLVPAMLILTPIIFLLTIGCSASDPESDELSGVIVDDIRRVELLLSNYKFSATNLVFEHGDRVEFSLESTDSIHTFTIEQLDLNWTVSAGQTLTEKFTFTSPGRFTLVCIIPSHEALGMKGTVIVR